MSELASQEGYYNEREDDIWEGRESEQGEMNPLVCTKIRYDDKKAAVSQINRLAKKRGRHGRPDAFRAYRCPTCSGWHLTKGDEE